MRCLSASSSSRGFFICRAPYTSTIRAVSEDACSAAAPEAHTAPCPGAAIRDWIRSLRSLRLLVCACRYSRQASLAPAVAICGLPTSSDFIDGEIEQDARKERGHLILDIAAASGHEEVMRHVDCSTPDFHNSVAVRRV